MRQLFSTLANRQHKSVIPDNTHGESHDYPDFLARRHLQTVMEYRTQVRLSALSHWDRASD